MAASDPTGASSAEARALTELAWTLRTHAEAEVRRGCLIALCAVGRALLPSVLLAEYESLLPELQDWLRATASEDADDGCRQLQ